MGHGMPTSTREWSRSAGAIAFGEALRQSSRVTRAPAATSRNDGIFLRLNETDNLLKLVQGSVGEQDLLVSRGDIEATDWVVLPDDSEEEPE